MDVHAINSVLGTLVLIMTAVVIFLDQYTHTKMCIALDLAIIPMLLWKSWYLATYEATPLAGGIVVVALSILVGWDLASNINRYSIYHRKDKD